MSKSFSFGKLAANLALLAIVLVWVTPTVGLLVSSVRDRDQLATNGWWTAPFASVQSQFARTGQAGSAVETGGLYIIKGNLFAGRERTPGEIIAFGTSSRAPGAFAAGDTVPIKNSQMTVEADGSYRWESREPFTHKRGRRVFFEERSPPRFTFENYIEVMTSAGLAQSFINSATVTIPATLIPIMIAAFAAYAFSWMVFPGRQFLFVVVVGLLVVPLQMSLIPVLRMFNDIGMGKSFPSIWLAHTGFGLPLAIYLLRNYMSGLPRELMESARIDGANHFKIFLKIVLPLSVPALASFAIFQFLWVWNDLLVALVFLGLGDEQVVLTAKLRELLGSRSDNWEVLTASAFVSIAVPLAVFLSLQRFFVRGLLAGSVKGG